MCFFMVFTDPTMKPDTPPPAGSPEHFYPFILHAYSVANTILIDEGLSHQFGAGPGWSKYPQAD
jgi:hypothetical protein